VSLDLVRTVGPDRVAETLLALPRGTHVVVNAATPADIEVVALATLRVEAAGRRLLFRTAASLVAARLGQRPAGCLTRADFNQTGPDVGGLVAVGSFVPKTTEQLARLRATHRLCTVELDVRQIVERGTAVADSAARIASAAIARGENAIEYTTRELLVGANRDETLRIGAAISPTLIHVVQRLEIRPRFLIAKGGITSSDVATEGPGVRRARVLGQLLPGVPVRALGPEPRFPI
jgi:uncharacterized protein YgbK (DUF1537 family)